MAKKLIEDTRQEQAQLAPDSQEYADLDWVATGFTDMAEVFQEDIKALKASQPDMVTTARRRSLPDPSPAAERRVE